MCTIADAKVRQNYNCYNVYFYECLHSLNVMIFSFIFIIHSAKIKETPAVLGQRFKKRDKTMSMLFNQCLFLSLLIKAFPKEIASSSFFPCSFASSYASAKI